MINNNRINVVFDILFVNENFFMLFFISASVTAWIRDVGFYYIGVTSGILGILGVNMIISQEWLKVSAAKI